jgi:hypothetical protein
MLLLHNLYDHQPLLIIRQPFADRRIPGKERIEVMVSPELTLPTVSPGLTEQAAAGLVRNHGVLALTILSERAEIAEELGHRVAAKTWHQIADAAARLLRMEGSDRDRAWPAPFAARHAAPFRAGFRR